MFLSPERKAASKLDEKYSDTFADPSRTWTVDTATSLDSKISIASACTVMCPFKLDRPAGRGAIVNDLRLLLASDKWRDLFDNL